MFYGSVSVLEGKADEAERRIKTATYVSSISSLWRARDPKPALYLADILPDAIQRLVLQRHHLESSDNWQLCDLIPAGPRAVYALAQIVNFTLVPPHLCVAFIY